MNYLEFYQNIPQYIDPIAFSIGSFAIRWYSLMWIVGIGVVYIFLSIQNKKNNLGNYGLRIT
ncbi:MAG TPA: hypothetical protein DEA27_02685, partial [Candidatus Moranbacteria bacterium]|nr:hypothetical protein [Candidatus Moranbacteria bacterium]